MSSVRNIHKIFEFVNGNKGKIGPHEGKVAALMLSGEKPVGHLILPNNRDQIEQLHNAVLSGKMSMLDSPDTWTDESGIKYGGYYFCQSGKEQDMQRLFELFEGGKEINSYEEFVEVTHEIGTILGYSEDDINLFLKWHSSFMLQGLVWYQEKKLKFLSHISNLSSHDLWPVD